MLATRTFTSPLGTLHLQASEGGVRRVSFGGVESAPAAPAGPLAEAHLDRLASELEAYFGGATSGFSVALDAQGTDFQKRVWRELMAIPSGQTRSYLEVARGMGKPGASRAVGLANGANPIAIVVPCHRVIGSAGTLTGYAGELWRKQWLLDHERANAGLFAPVMPEDTCVAAKRFRMPC